MNVSTLEAILISEADSNQVETLKNRGAFAREFCMQKGWDIDDLSIEQLLELRRQPQWQNPI